MKNAALKFVLIAAFLVSSGVSQAQSLFCEGVFSFSTSSVFSWENHQWPLPVADPISLTMSSLERLQEIGATPLQILKESALKDVYLVEWQGQTKIAKVYRSSSIEKLNQTLQRDYLMGEFLPLVNVRTARLQIEPEAVRLGVVLQDYHPQIAAQIPEIRIQPVWALLLKQVVALEMNTDFRSWAKSMRQSYRGLEVDFRADNVALEPDGQGGWGHPVFIDW